MSMNLPYCGSRFGGRPEPVERDVEPEPLEPETEEEYAARLRDAGNVKGFQTALLIMEHHLRNMSEDVLDEVEAHTGIRLLDLQEYGLPGASKARAELQTAIKAYEVKT